MKKNKYDILLISSLSLTSGPGALAMQIHNNLSDKGSEVDILTLVKDSKISKALYIYKKQSKFNNLLFKIYRKLWLKPKDGYCFFYRKETTPPVSPQKLLNKINKKYDAVIIYFWQNLLSVKTVEMLYDKLKCKFIFICADYSPMSGGCHFTNECQRFVLGCGSCPAFDSHNPNDFTHWNILYRKRVYEKIKPIVIANKYMIEYFFKKSFLLNNCKFIYSKGSINHQLFKPIEKMDLYEKYKIPSNKKYIISFGCQSLSDPRKGMSYLIEALDLVYNQLTIDEKNNTMLLFIGNNDEKIKSYLKFDYKSLGYIPVNELPSFYSVSTVFVCSSVNDAGPSMISQSLACGTPVVSFKMGAALDLVLGHETGYCAELYNSIELADGILNILRMNSDSYTKLRTHCVDFSRKECSREASAKLLLSAIEA